MHEKALWESRNVYNRDMSNSNANNNNASTSASQMNSSSVMETVISQVYIEIVSNVTGATVFVPASTIMGATAPIRTSTVVSSTTTGVAVSIAQNLGNQSSPIRTDQGAGGTGGSMFNLPFSAGRNSPYGKAT
ncbi:hypothetical protein QL285_019535 [Trifolium repens]|nr:hypothetical protein QL285_019535 [Trifolium repens]